MGRIRRRWPWVASGLVHAGLLALLALLARPPTRSGEEAAIEIEVTSPAAEATTPATEPRAAAGDELEAASEAAGPPAKARVRRALQPAPAPTPEPAGGGAVGETAETGLGLGWELGALGGAGGGGAGGGGGGDGDGGLGGAGAGRAHDRARPVRVALRRVSKARPPRLVYPKRFRDERGGEVFVALLTVDEDGWVVGVRLVQGVDPYADEKALTAVWRFHYEPALDDAGRPVSAKVEQRFMVE